MPKNSSGKMPAGATPLLTYDALAREARAFAKGERNLLIVVGPPGTAKSHHLKEHLPGARFLEGGATPYRLYLDLFESRDRPVVLDDADKVFRDRDGLFLLKLATQSTHRKVIQWNRHTAEIRSGEVPREFETTSRVAIVANSWPRDNPDVEAVESRGHLCYFNPPPREVHEYAGRFVPDRAVYEYVGRHVDLFDRLHLRVYLTASEMKRTHEREGGPETWKLFVQGHLMGEDARVALGLMRDVTFTSDNRRAHEFARLTGASERTFYRVRDQVLGRLGGAGAARNGDGALVSLTRHTPCPTSRSA